ncbi:MAG: clostripain-related cysteine peptidase, partial [Lachnospiraceae bacterium]|nr:clostripain-related cysteine peptidase [Lachnospiraceae bacterium]
MKKTKQIALLIAGLFTLMSGCADAETAASDPKKMAAKAGTIAGSTDPGWTIMVYLCGSDLESSSGMASMNLEEMCSAVIPDNVNVLVETGGSSAWYWDGIETDVLGRYQVVDGSLEEAETAELASMGDPSTLTDFIQWGMDNYPSEHYGVILWDHGGGNADGVCYDELYDGDNLTLPELGSALSDTGSTLDFIGFDACLMA